jgi:beta-phosphoglucomutase-like phosphatase (HAD superfamily)
VSPACPRIRAVMLDFNGTLAQDDRLVAGLYVECFARVGAELSEQEYHRDLGALPDREVFDLALRRAGIPADDARRDALVRARVEGYLAAVADAPPISPAAAAFVRATAERVPLAIASGAFRREIEHVLDASGLTAYFPVVVAIDDVADGKPDPAGFLLALARLNAALGPDPPIGARETVVVEDATGGTQAARAAGMRVAALRGPAYDPASGYADIVIDRLEPAALDAVLGTR